MVIACDTTLRSWRGVALWPLDHNQAAARTSATPTQPRNTQRKTYTQMVVQNGMATAEKLSDGALIQRYVDMDSDDRGPAYARLSGYGIHVWAVIGYWKAVQNDTQVARDYDIPSEYVEAAKAYYRHYQRYIDAFLILNEPPEDAPAPPEP